MCLKFKSLNIILFINLKENLKTCFINIYTIVSLEHLILNQNVNY